MRSAAATAFFVYLIIGLGLIVTRIHVRIWDILRRDGVVREDYFGPGNPRRDWYFNRRIASAIYLMVISTRFVGKVLLIANTAYLLVAFIWRLSLKLRVTADLVVLLSLTDGLELAMTRQSGVVA